MLSEYLRQKVKQYKKDGKDLFSHTEKIVVALSCPDLYRRLMPERFLCNPMEAYYTVLDGNQRMVVMACHKFNS